MACKGCYYLCMRNFKGISPYMQLISFLKSRGLWISLLLMLFMIIAGIVGVASYLDSYTNHDLRVEVPSLEGFHYTEVANYVADKDLHVFVADSVFDAQQPRGIVMEQNPAEGQLVKPGRKIYLTINSVEVPSIGLPELKDYTVRQVVMKVETYGLKIDSMIYKPAECDACVIGVMYNGEEVEAGTRVPKGSGIWLVVGEGFGVEKVTIPMLTGQPALRVKSVLNTKGLNVGFVQYDTTVKTSEDSMNAFVYNQKPKFDSSAMVRLGTAFDLYFTIDSNKIDTLELLPLDSNKTSL